jgi:hypothetical protein
MIQVQVHGVMILEIKHITIGILEYLIRLQPIFVQTLVQDRLRIAKMIGVAGIEMKYTLTLFIPRHSICAPINTIAKGLVMHNLVQQGNIPAPTRFGMEQ